MALESIVQRNLSIINSRRNGRISKTLVSDLTGVCRNIIDAYMSQLGLSYSYGDVKKAIRKSRPILENWPGVTLLAEAYGIPKRISIQCCRNEALRKEYAIILINGQYRFDPKKVPKLTAHYRPELENWPTVEEICEEFNLPKHYVRSWHRNPETRKKTGARINSGRIYYDPKKIEKIRKSMKRISKDDEWLDRTQARLLLGDYADRILSSSSTPYFKLCPNKRKKMYPKKKLVRLKTFLERIEKGGFMTTEEVSTKLNIPIRKARENIPHVVNPLDKHLLYKPSVVKKYAKSIFTRCNPFVEILEYCASKIYNDATLVKKVKLFVTNRDIPAENIRPHKALYLPPESEDIVERIFRNHKQMRIMKDEFLSMPEGAQYLGVGRNIFDHIIEKYGIEFVLSEKNLSNLVKDDVPMPLIGRRKYTVQKQILETEFAGGSNSDIYLIYFRYFRGRGPKYAPKSALDALVPILKCVEQEAEKNCFSNTYNGHWHEKFEKLAG